jgi:hypothetical protein
MPNAVANPFVHQGTFDGSVISDLNSCVVRQMVSNITTVQDTNPTSATTLMTANLGAGALNTVGQTLEIFGAGVTNLTTTTAAMTFNVYVGGVIIFTVTTGNFAVGALNLPWNFSIMCTVASVGAGGAITLEVHGGLSASLTTVAGSATNYNDANVAVSSSISAAAPTQVLCNAFISAGNAASFIAQRQLIVQLLN